MSHAYLLLSFCDSFYTNVARRRRSRGMTTPKEFLLLYGHTQSHPLRAGVSHPCSLKTLPSWEQRSEFPLTTSLLNFSVRKLRSLPCLWCCAPVILMILLSAGLCQQQQFEFATFKLLLVHPKTPTTRQIVISTTVAAMSSCFVFLQESRTRLRRSGLC